MAHCVGQPDGVVVERVGASGQSVTYVDPERREARGCDARAPITGTSPWCGRAYARLRARRLADPRLSLTCRSRGDEPLAFAWVQPAAGSSYVVVAQPGYSEVYRVAGRVPVRITTANVDLGDASAVFAISEHAPDGRVLRTYDLEAHVSG
jgi:hypothetical protein